MAILIHALIQNADQSDPGFWALINGINCILDFIKVNVVPNFCSAAHILVVGDLRVELGGQPPCPLLSLRRQLLY